MTATFSEAVTRLNAHEFAVTNGTASGLAGGGSTWAVTITPAAVGAVTISLPEGAVIDADGNPNAASNTLVTTYAPPAGAGTTISTSVAVSAGRTADSVGNVPADGSNNLAKFTAGSINDGVPAPYTSTLYVRSSSSDALRRVRAFARFDLSVLPGLPVAAATLRFNAHSLNDQEALEIELLPLAADWAASGAPAPSFDHATVGGAIGGGSLITGLDPGDHTRDYSFDLTGTVRNWLDGTWADHGIRLQLASTTVDNGAGIKPSGAGAIELRVEQAPLFITAISLAPRPEDVTIAWNSAPGASYRVEANDDLRGAWDPVGEVAGAAGSRTTYTHVDGMDGFTTRFYRVVFPGN